MDDEEAILTLNYYNERTAVPGETPKSVVLLLIQQIMHDENELC